MTTYTVDLRYYQFFWLKDTNTHTHAIFRYSETNQPDAFNPSFSRQASCFQLECEVYRHLATKHKFIFHLYMCMLPLEGR